MVDISNDRENRKVTMGAYNTIYKNKGYYIVGGKKRKEESKAIPFDPVSAEVMESLPTNEVEPIEEIEEVESEWVVELLEKPISQWSKEEVTNFVKEKGIDTSSAHKLSEVKDIIKKWLEEQNK